jgi:transposase
VISGGAHPDHSCIADFRARHREAFAEIFGQVLKLCTKAKLVKLGHIAIDGTRMKANASKHKAMSHGRMKKQEAELKAEVEEIVRLLELHGATG